MEKNAIKNGNNRGLILAIILFLIAVLAILGIGITLAGYSHSRTITDGQGNSLYIGAEGSQN